MFYINEENEEATIRHLDEFQEDIDNNILNELIETEKLVNKIVKNKGDSKGSILVPGDYRNRSIYYIAKSLKKHHIKKNAATADIQQHRRIVNLDIIQK